MVNSGFKLVPIHAVLRTGGKIVILEVESGQNVLSLALAAYQTEGTVIKQSQSSIGHIIASFR